MGQLSKLKPVLMGVGGLLVLYLIYTFGSQIDLSGNSMKKAEDIQLRTEELERTLLSQLDSLHTIKLDTRLFQSPEWRELKDFSKPLSVPVIGRPDPFAEFSNVSTPEKK